MTFDSFKDPDGGYRFEGAWYDDEHSLVLSGMLGFCGCGMPKTAARYVRDTLRHIERLKILDHKAGDYTRWAAEETALHGSTGAAYFTYYVLDAKGYLEHGGAVPGWLTGKGRELLDYLNALPEEP